LIFGKEKLLEGGVLKEREARVSAMAEVIMAEAIAEKRTEHETPKKTMMKTPSSENPATELKPLPSSLQITPMKEALLRPKSAASSRSRQSRKSSEIPDASSTTGVILIGMDVTDAATTVSRSRRSSSSAVDPPRPSETNDTDHDETEIVDYTTKTLTTTTTTITLTSGTFARPTSRRRSLSSISDSESDHNIDEEAERPIVPVPEEFDDPDRLNSSESPRPPSSSSSDSPRPRRSSYSSSTSRHRHTSSIDSTTRNTDTTATTNRPHQFSTTTTATTTGIHGESSSSRPPSATEFQKFRDQLHSVASNPAFRPLTNTPGDSPLHPNPHHPGPQTEILRIDRVYTPIALPTKTHVSQITNYDVMIPRFSPAFPSLLRDLGIQEAEWRGFIERVNRGCMEAFDPFRVSNVLLNMVAVLTFWLSEWIMPNLAKKVFTLLVN
jgi:Golgin subfamily A member 7/ERF4 family